MPCHITGTRVILSGDDGRREFTFQPGPAFCRLYPAWRRNRSPRRRRRSPRWLQAMAELQVTVTGDAYRLNPPYFVMATLFRSRWRALYPLPEAQLDRFLFKVPLELSRRRRTDANYLVDDRARGSGNRAGVSRRRSGQWVEELKKPSRICFPQWRSTRRESCARPSPSIRATSGESPADARRDGERYVMLFEPARGAGADHWGPRCARARTGAPMLHARYRRGGGVRAGASHHA